MGGGASNAESVPNTLGRLCSDKQIEFKLDLDRALHSFSPKDRITSIDFFQSSGVFKHSWIVGEVKGGTYYFSLSKFETILGLYLDTDEDEVIDKGLGSRAKGKEIKQTIGATNRTMGDTIAYVKANYGHYNKLNSNCNDFAKQMWKWFTK